MRKRFSSLLILFTLVFTSCEGNWGGNFKDFAGNEAPALSRDYAKKTLRERWQEYFYRNIFHFSTELSASQIKIETLTDSLKAPEILFEEVEFSESEYKKVRDFLKDLLKRRRNLTEFTIRQTKLNETWREIVGICKDRQTFKKLGVNHYMLKEVFGGSSSLPEYDATYTIMSGNPYQILFDVGFNLFFKEEFEEQERQFKEGLSLLEKKIIRDDELFELSKGICLEEKAKWKKGIRSIDQSFGSLRSMRNEASSHLQTQEELVLKKMRPFEWENLTEEWIRDIFASAQQQTYENRVRNFLDKTFSHIKEALMSRGKPSSFKEIKRQEMLRDSLLASQLEMQKIEPLIESQALSERLEHLEGYIEMALKKVTKTERGGQL